MHGKHSTPRPARPIPRMERYKSHFPRYLDILDLDPFHKRAQSVGSTPEKALSWHGCMDNLHHALTRRPLPKSILYNPGLTCCRLPFYLCTWDPPQKSSTVEQWKQAAQSTAQQPVSTAPPAPTQAMGHHFRNQLLGNRQRFEFLVPVSTSQARYSGILKSNSRANLSCCL